MTKTVGLTMRLDYTQHGEARIAVDQAWLSLLTDLGFHPVLLPFGGVDAKGTVELLKPDAIILTGGNDVLKGDASYSEGRNKFEFDLLDISIEQNIPVLGVCRGMQIMNIYGGGNVQKRPHHTAVNHVVQWNDRKYTVNSYHNFCIPPQDIAPEFIIDATAEDETIEAFHHTKYPWAAVMWHPEREIEDKNSHHTWIRNFLNGAIS